MKSEQDKTVRASDSAPQPTRDLNSRTSIWVMIGFMFWIGFFIGAVILHAMVK